MMMLIITTDRIACIQQIIIKAVKKFYSLNKIKL